MSTTIWTFKYEPKTFNEMVLNPDLKVRLEKAIKEKPNLMLVGPAGVGKGTFTNIFLRETGLDYMKLNCSDETSIDVMRTKVKSFATALGVTDIKVVILNESDWISPAGQAMLRDLMEQVQKITRFIFQCNYGNKIIPELQSRCQVFEFSAPPIKDIAVHCLKILKEEKVTVKDKQAVVETIKKLYPDIRRMINTLQMNTINGVLDHVRIEEVNEIYSNILKMMKEGDLEGLRRTIRSNAINWPELYSYLFEEAGAFKSPGDAIIHIGEHLYRDSLVAIKEINFMTMVVLMIKKGII